MLIIDYMIAKILIKLQLIIPFIKRFLQDKRIPLFTKVIVVSGILYLVSFVDLSPDFLPVIGWIDDLIIVPLLVGGGLKSVGHSILSGIWQNLEKEQEQKKPKPTIITQEG